MFIHFNGKIVNTDRISRIFCTSFAKTGTIDIIYVGNEMPLEEVKGAEAVNVIMALCPAVLEGKRAKHQRHSWAVHNLIGHPLMQIFAWLRLPALGVKIHDATVPEPEVEE